MSIDAIDRDKRRRKSMLGQKTLSHRLKDDKRSLPVKMKNGNGAGAHLVPFKTSRTMKR
jgi:hypothetical protein